MGNKVTNRGVNDILIACIHYLNGFAEAINVVFARTEMQTCVIHQIRNSLIYVASKDQKKFMNDLKPIYKADTLDLAERRLEELEAKWGEKYEKVPESWRRNWPKLSTYYTTNTIEGFRRQVRKVTKTKGAFTSGYGNIKADLSGTEQHQPEVDETHTKLGADRSEPRWLVSW